MKILGIETSCDETAAAMVENGTKILSSIVATSSEMHAKTGGIIPEVAARQQIKSIVPVIKESLSKAKTDMDGVDAVAVTVGPGLIGSLLVGVETAKTLSYIYKKPILPVNHLVAHIYANWLEAPPPFPALALVVSGGHTDMVFIKNHGDISWLGGTKDDAAGEAFDKTARVLGLPYPGGPQIAKEAEEFRKSHPNHILDLLPRPILNEQNYDFSFSGLKTAVLRVFKDKPLDIKLLSAQIEEAITDVLVTKTIRAVKEFKPKSLLLAGGVAANSRLKEKFQTSIKKEKLDVKFYVPSPSLCTDNAAYIASYAFFNFSPIPWSKIKPSPELTIVGEPS